MQLRRAWRTAPSTLKVSILTRPGGRVQHYIRLMRGEQCKLVSILTRPGGRVQLPARRVGATASIIQFQSSPVPEDGCNRPGYGTSFKAEGFNPHPSRRTGATCWVRQKRG